MEISSIWHAANEYLNSSLVSSLTGALAGALVGALSAQRIANRSSERAALQGELRNTNAAIMIAFSIGNAGLALKDQQVKALFTRWESQKRELDEHLRKRSIGEVPKNSPFEFRADLRQLQALQVPMDVLRTQI